MRFLPVRVDNSDAGIRLIGCAANDWNRDRDKQIGIIAKVVKQETGITSALKDFEKTYNDWGWDRVDDSSLDN